jgi:hypothetical protein
MTFIPPTADLPWLVRDATAAMISTATITHTGPGTINDDNTENPGPITTTTVPARFIDTLTRMREIVIAMQITGEVHAILSVPLGTTVTTDDTVTMGGVTYEIVGTNANVTYRTAVELAVRLP